MAGFATIPACCHPAMTDATDQQPAPDTLSLDDFHRSGAAALLAAHPDAPLTDLRGRFLAAAQAAHEDGRTASAAVLRLLGGICSMMLQPGSSTKPLAPLFVWADGRRSMEPDDLEPDQVDLLARLVDEVRHVALRARLADLVWMQARRLGHRFALSAIDDYRTAPIDTSAWAHDGEASWHRALQLAVSLRAAGGDRVARMVAALVQAFHAALEGDGEPLGYLRPLAALRLAKHESPQIAAELEQLAHARMEGDNTFATAASLEAAKAWFEHAGNPDKAAEMQMLLARNLERHADRHPSAVTRNAYYGDAIAAYRAVPAPFRGRFGVEQALLAVRAKYEEAGRETVGEMTLIRGPSIDLAPLAKEAVAYVQHRDPLDALCAFYELDPVPDKARYLQEAEARLSGTMVGRLFGSVAIAEDGRTIARNAGAAAGDELAFGKKVESDAMQAFVEDARIAAVGMVRPALEAIREQHLLTLEDFRTFARHSGIVPADRADIVGQGLHAGYCHDLVQALHLLMPQFEHMVRELLKRHDALTTTHNTEGLDMELGLSSLVERAAMEAFFGADLTFAIRALMCVQPGPNLRNAVAHGLADAALCQGPFGLYGWWFILRLVVRAFRARWDRAAAAAAGESPAAPTEASP
jgi:hypothetical protein